MSVFLLMMAMHGAFSESSPGDTITAWVGSSLRHRYRDWEGSESVQA